MFVCRPATPEPPSRSAKPGVISNGFRRQLLLAAGQHPEFAVIVQKSHGRAETVARSLRLAEDNNYRTVVHLLKPGEPDGARDQVERRGLKYQTIEVSDVRLGQAVEEFNRVLGAADNQPVFVYDRDGTLAGPLWYLRFRSVDRLADEEARRKATSLGLRDDGTGDSISLWVAIQEYLRKNK